MLSGTAGASERGVALVAALAAVAWLAAIGLALAIVAASESTVAFNFATAYESRHAADAGAERVVQDLSGLPRWSDALDGTATSTFVDSTTVPTLADGRVVNLSTETTRLQNRSNALSPWGADNPVWRLFAYGPLRQLVPSASLTSLHYVVIWVADDPSESDGDPYVDTNGTLTLHVEAYGPAAASRVLELTIQQASGVRVLSWRDSP